MASTGGSDHAILGQWGASALDVAQDDNANLWGLKGRFETRFRCAIQLFLVQLFKLGTRGGHRLQGRGARRGALAPR